MCHVGKTTTHCMGASHSLPYCPTKNGLYPGQSSLHQLLEVRTLCEAMPFLPEMQEVWESHHSLLHKYSMKKHSRSRQSSQFSQTQEHPKVVAMHMSQSGHQQQVLLMTCQVILIGLNGTSYKARALLDSDSVVE